MQKQLTVLIAMLLTVLVAAAPALAQDEVPACEIGDACGDTSDEQDTGSTEQAEALTVPPAQEVECEEIPVGQTFEQEPGSNGADQPSGTAPACGDAVQSVNSAGNVQSASTATIPQSTSEAASESGGPVLAPAACGVCTDAVLTAAKEAITESGSGGATPAEAFDAALQAARGAGGTREAVASETGGGLEGEAAGTPVEDTAAYQAAFEAAKEAGADEETAREAALEAVASTTGDAPEDATGSEGAIGKTAGKGNPEKATGKKASRESSGKDGTGKDGGGNAQEENAGKDDTNEDHEGKTRNRNAASEETTGDSETGGDNIEDASAGGGAPLLMGGGVLLVAGAYAALRAARPRS